MVSCYDKIHLIDEIHTPDSSRYFYAEGFEERQAKGEPQKQLSKEFLRQWLIAAGFQGKDGQPVPEMTDEIVIVFRNATLNCTKRLLPDRLSASRRKIYSCGLSETY